MVNVRWLMPRTIRWRLTAVLVTVMAVLLVTLVATQYFLLRDFLYHRVEVTAANAGRLVLERHAPPKGGPKEPPRPTTPLTVRAGPLLQDLATSGYSGQVLDAGGSLVQQTQGSDGSTPPALPAPQPSRDATALGGARQVAYITSFQGAQFTIVDLPIAPDPSAGSGGVLRVVAPLSQANATLRSLLELDAAIVGAGLVLVLVLAPWLAGLSLRPLGQVVSIATAVGRGDWTHRDRLPSGDDEVGRVGEALRVMIAEIQARLTAQERFVADASHELQTPLTTFRSTLELLLLEVDRTPEERLRLLANLRRETLRMSRLVDDLLALARSGETPRLATPFVVATAVDEAVEEVGQSLALRTVTFDLDRSVRVSGDSDAIRRVVRNLLENAATFTSEGGAINVSVRRTGDQAELSVSDDGVGIAPEHLDHIFDRLYRADASRWRGRGGAGLGLAIVQAAVTAHGGNVRVASEPGKGSTFTVALPLVRAAGSRANPAGSAVEPPIGEAGVHNHAGGSTSPASRVKPG